MTLILILIIFSLDRLTKIFVSKNLPLNHSIPVIKGLFHITLVHNYGAAFGIFKNQVLLFVVISLITIVLIFLDLKKNRKKHSYAYKLALCFILAGAAGNLLDRLFFGYVIDFLDFRIWPVFNIADSAISVGAVLLGWSILRPQKT